MSAVFDEGRMIQFLERCMPAGEALEAGVHGIGIETKIRQVFADCSLAGDNIIPDEAGGMLEVSKKKYTNYDVYIGITEHFLLLAECDIYEHYYEFDDKPDLTGVSVRRVEAPVSIKDIGTCFPLAEIKDCVIKKGMMGSMKCFITMQGGSVLKLMLPKLGGVGGGMPHHREYREAILARLGSLSCAR